MGLAIVGLYTGTAGSTMALITGMSFKKGALKGSSKTGSQNGTMDKVEKKVVSHNGVAVAISASGLERRQWFHKGSHSLGRCGILWSIPRKGLCAQNIKLV